MDILNQLFSSLIFTKIKVSDGYALYAAKIQSFVGNGFRYIILAVLFERAPLNQALIQNLQWSSLQTRTLQEDYNIPEQVLDYKVLDPRYSNYKIKLNVKDRNSNQTTYFSQIPIEVALLHDPKKKSVYQYNDTMELRQALNTFQCVVRKM